MELFSARRCLVCNKSDIKLLQCSRCRQRYYCSKECQKVDWKDGHKEYCKELHDTDANIAKIQKHIFADKDFIFMLGSVIRGIKKKHGKHILLPCLFIMGEPWKEEKRFIVIFPFTTAQEIIKTTSVEMKEEGREKELETPENIPLLRCIFLEDLGNNRYKGKCNFNVYFWNTFNPQNKGSLIHQVMISNREQLLKQDPCASNTFTNEDWRNLAKYACQYLNAKLEWLEEEPGHILLIKSHISHTHIFNETYFEQLQEIASKPKDREITWIL